MKLQIIFATGNHHKLHEIREILTEMGLSEEDVSLRSMKEANVAADPEENGNTFEENALIKARAVAATIESSDTFVCDPATPLVVLSDDSGLCIDALHGEPGIHSARFMGHDTDYTIKMNAILDQLREVPDAERGAQFVAAVACVAPNLAANATLREDPAYCDGYTVRGVMEGAIAHDIKGVNGFGYDPFFYLPQYGCSSAEITEEEKNAISHRGQALRSMMSKLSTIIA